MIDQLIINSININISTSIKRKSSKQNRFSDRDFEVKLQIKLEVKKLSAKQETETY